MRFFPSTKIKAILAIALSLSTKLVLANTVLPADYKFESYIPLIKNQRVAIFSNNSAQINNLNLVEALRQKGVNVVKIFSPEHGFLATADAGSKVANSSYKGIPIISLYGKKEQPSVADLTNVDVVVFDIQDVGVRYYTYISSLQKLMEALVINNKPLIILDRPNPNAHYIDGPVLESQYKSFVGMQAIPIVYGMTIGEYAQMLVGEHWLNLPIDKQESSLQLTIITVDNYTHKTKYTPPIPPSPNLPNATAISLYPSLGWFEGTQISVGRGTDMPFQIYGSPLFESTLFSFIPHSKVGAKSPPFNNQICFGWDLRQHNNYQLELNNNQIELNYLLNAYRYYPDKDHFFTNFFNKLSGNKLLQEQIKTGVNESVIRASWHNDLVKFKAIRQKYLLYP